MTLALERSHRHAERVTAAWARSFHFASRFLPARKRRGVFALYDYCRHVDNLVDERGDRPEAAVRVELAGMRALVRRVHGGALPDGERWLALHDTLHRFPVPLEPLLELVDGVERDLDPAGFTDYGELEEYCRKVAGGVGLMLGPVLGADQRRLREPGVGLGIAMQLTNILRDVGEDLARGRCYLPADELAAFGLTPEVLGERPLSPRFIELMRFQVRRARVLFDRAEAVLPLFPTDGSRLTVRLMQRTYAGILDVIERQGYDVFSRRAYTSRTHKALILGRAWLAERGPAPPILTPERSA